MDEKALLDWKEANKDVYSMFKQDLEEQLLKPYHQTILDLGDGNAELLQSKGPRQRRRHILSTPDRFCARPRSLRKLLK